MARERELKFKVSSLTQQAKTQELEFSTQLSNLKAENLRVIEARNKLQAENEPLKKQVDEL
jgi:regulator of replication initiation timing